MMHKLAVARQHLTEISNDLANVIQYFPTIAANDNAHMTTEQRTAMRVALAQAEELIDNVRKQLFDAQK